MSALRLLAVLLLSGGVLGVALFGGKETDVAATAHAEPAMLEQVDGEGLSRVVLTARAAERLGIETAPIRDSAEGAVVPYAALIYDAHGDTWVYTSPEPLVYLRAPVEVERIEGQVTYLAGGPASGTDVVTVGGAELYGTEFEVGH